MSTFTDISKSKVTVSIVRKEIVIHSIIKDLFTFSCIALCIYISQGSAWWTFVTGLMFLFMLFIKLSAATGRDSKTFNDEQGAIDCLTRLKAIENTK
tara:strand:+ start:223 stop:513 length:291 start_codon:yes stop_codon:yes gene_type:complete